MKRFYILLALLLCAMLAFGAQAVETTVGETVTVPIYVETSNAAVIELNINYDRTVFEAISISCTAPGGQAHNTTMVMYVTSGTIPAGQVGSMTLKVKDNVDFGTYNLSIASEAFDLNENFTSVNAYADPIVVTCLHRNTEETKMVEADCENDGIREVTCKDCGEITESEILEKLGHDFAQYVETRPATCVEAGEEIAKCTRCEKEDVREIEMLGHEIVVDEGIDATCTEEGLTEGSHCSVCEEILVAQETIPAPGHTEEKLEAKEPTCAEPGLTEGVRCSVCEEIITPQEEIPALSHDEGIWVEVSLPTMTSEGLSELRCTVCEGVIESKKIPALENNIPAPSVQTVKAKKGDTITLNVLVASNDAKMLTVVVNCDSSAFELISTECGGTVSSGNSLMLYSLGNTISGKIGTVTLKVKDTASDGLYTVSASVVEAYDIDERPTVAAAAVDRVQIINRIPGDANDDGSVDGRDLLRLARFVGGYSVTINKDNATVNGDASVDGRDLLRLAKFLGGFSVTLE